jgi:hypothetical protein
MPTQTSLLSRRVLFHPDGEAIDRTDDENVQLFSRQDLHNLILSGLFADGIGEPTDPGSITRPEALSHNDIGVDTTQGVFAPWPGAGYVVPTGTNNQVQFTAGPMVTVIDEPWSYGNDGEEFCLYRIGGGITLTTAAGDATNPRIDLVEVKLEYIDGDPQTRHFEDATTRAPSSQAGTDKERQVQLTYQIKQGTPAANPTYPTPTAGFQAYAAIYVPATHNTVHSPDNIRDLRFPFGVRCIDVDRRGFYYTGSNPWVDFGMLASAAASSDPDDDRVIVPCPISTKSARLIAVGLHGDLGGDARIGLGRLDYGNANPIAEPTFVEYCDLGGIASANGFCFADAMMIADTLNVGAVLRGVRAANTRVGTPMWCNGRPGGMAHPGIAPDAGVQTTTSRLAISFGGETGADCRVGFVRFWIAEGLG